MRSMVLKTVRAAKRSDWWGRGWASLMVLAFSHQTSEVTFFSPDHHEWGSKFVHWLLPSQWGLGNISQANIFQSVSGQYCQLVCHKLLDLCHSPSDRSLGAEFSTTTQGEMSASLQFLFRVSGFSAKIGNFHGNPAIPPQRNDHSSHDTLRNTPRRGRLHRARRWHKDITWQPALQQVFLFEE